MLVFFYRHVSKFLFTRGAARNNNYTHGKNGPQNNTPMMHCMYAKHPALDIATEVCL